MTRLILAFVAGVLVEWSRPHGTRWQRRQVRYFARQLTARYITEAGRP